MSQEFRCETSVQVWDECSDVRRVFRCETSVQVWDRCYSMSQVFRCETSVQVWDKCSGLKCFCICIICCLTCNSAQVGSCSVVHVSVQIVHTQQALFVVYTTFIYVYIFNAFIISPENWFTQSLLFTHPLSPEKMWIISRVQFMSESSYSVQVRDKCPGNRHRCPGDFLNSVTGRLCPDGTWPAGTDWSGCWPLASYIRALICRCDRMSGFVSCRTVMHCGKTSITNWWTRRSWT